MPTAIITAVRRTARLIRTLTTAAMPARAACRVALLATVVLAARAASAQPSPFANFTDGDFNGPWTVSTNGVATFQRIASGGFPDGPFVRAALSLPAVEFQCQAGCIDTPIYLFVVRDGPVYDPAQIGPITRFDGSGVPRIAAVSGVFIATSVSYGLLVEQNGCLFGSGMFGLPGQNTTVGCWTGCFDSDGCSNPGLNCGAGPIAPRLARLPDGRPGGPSSFDASQAGAPFRAGFYMKVEHGGAQCCGGGVFCCQYAVDVTMDLDQWRWVGWSCRPPTFTTQPDDATTCDGNTVTFTAAAPGPCNGGATARR